MFFNKEETDKVFRGDHEIVQKQYSCADCKLKLQCSTPKVPVIGEGAKRILIVAGAVHKSWEDSQGENKGPDYSFIKRQLKRVGIDMDKDCWFVHAVRCYTHDDPTPKTMSACHSVLVKDVAKLNPAVVVPLDDLAFKTLVYERTGGRADSSFYDYCGENIPDQKLKAWIIPIYTRQWYQQAAEKRVNKFEPMYQQILENIRTYSQMKVPDYSYEKLIQTTTDKKQALQWIKIIETWDRWAFDYETNSIKSQRNEAKLRTVAFSNGEITYAFPTEGLEEDIADLLCNRATKYAWNSAYEYVWGKNKLKVSTKNMEDPMILAHVYKNQKPKNLKFNTYVHFGHLGYDLEMEKYLKESTEDKDVWGDNRLNKIFDAPIRPLLTYNGTDPHFTIKLWDKMWPTLTEGQRGIYRLYMDGVAVFNDSHIRGVRIAEDKLAPAKKEIQSKIDFYSDRIQSNPEILHRWDWSSAFKASSDKMVRHLIFDILGLESVGETDKGLPSVDDEAMGQFVYTYPWLEDLRQFRRWSTAMTFIDSTKKEMVNGRIHGNINMHRTKTGRSSCIAKGSLVYVNRDYETHRGGVPIEEVKEGDYVLSIDKNLRPVYRKVLWAGKTGTRNVIRIHYTAGLSEHKYLDLTPEHEVMLYDGRWVQAQDLLNDCAVTWNNHAITRIEWLAGEVDVYDLKVEDTHNFIVNEICVHNCNSPNLQNQPHHDDEVMEYIRSLFLPDVGHKLAEYDYGQLEVRGSAAISMDESLIKYVTDSSSDMHRNFASKLFMLKPEEVVKPLRQICKGAVFALFYGSFYKLIAKSLWRQITTPDAAEALKFDCVAHLKKNGVSTYEEFEEQCQKAENWLWQTEFKHYMEYRWDTYDKFAEVGYTDYVTGFRYYGPASRNALGNAPVQGASFHCNLWAITQLYKYFKEKKMNSRIMLQVHDSVVISVDPMEEMLVDAAVYRFFSKEVREHFDWMIVPLPMEKSIGGVNEPWSKKKTIGVLGEDGVITH